MTAEVTVQSPSAVLNDLYATLSLPTFAAVLLEHLGTALDPLPAAQKPNLSWILAEAQISCGITREHFENFEFAVQQRKLEDFVIQLDANEPKPRAKTNRCPIGDPHASDEELRGRSPILEKRSWSKFRMNSCLGFVFLGEPASSLAWKYSRFTRLLSHAKRSRTAVTAIIGE